MLSFPTGPDYVPCDKFDPRHPWDPIIPSDEEMEADAKMEQDMILARKPREKLVKAQGLKVMSLLAPRVGEIVKPAAAQRLGGLPMKMAVVADLDGKRSSSSGTKRFSAPRLGSRSITEVRGRDRYTPSPVSAPGYSSVSAPSMPARVPPLLARPPGASTATSPVHILPPMSSPLPQDVLENMTPQMPAQIPLFAKLLLEGHKPADPAPVPIPSGKYGSTTDIPQARTPQTVAPAVFPLIHRPGDVGEPTYTPFVGLTGQLLPSPTHGQAIAPAISSSGLSPGQASQNSHVLNVSSLSKPAYDREYYPPISNAEANHQLADQEEDEYRKRKLNLSGRHPPERVDVTKGVDSILRGRRGSHAGVTDPFGPRDSHSHMYLSPIVGGSRRRVSGGGSHGQEYDNSRATGSGSRDGAFGSIPSPCSPLGACLSRDSSARYRGELRAEASRDLFKTPSELRRQQWDNMAPGQVQDRRDIPPRARSASPATFPTTPVSWNPGGEPNSLRVVYPRHPYPARNAQETPSKASTLRSTDSGGNQSVGAGVSTSGTQIDYDQWGYPIASPTPTAAQPPPNIVRSKSGSPPYSPPPGAATTPSTRSNSSNHHPRIPSETPSYEPPETFVKSDRSTPSYHPPSGGFAHASPSPPPQPSGQRCWTNPQSMQPLSHPGQSGSACAGSASASGLSGVRVRGIASDVEARAQAQAQAQTRAQTGVREQAPDRRGLEQRIGRTADNAVSRSAGSRAYQRRPRRTVEFAFRGRPPRRTRTRRH